MPRTPFRLFCCRLGGAGGGEADEELGPVHQVLFAHRTAAASWPVWATALGLRMGMVG